MCKALRTFPALGSHVIGKSGSEELRHLFLCHSLAMAPCSRQTENDFLILTNILYFIPIA